ncbi:hypothetical protein N7478_011837 [Penicillium angulare]|uniref:uncharacterized protein n=1 Tax=Penicillium angulare TaxID=116970 RepID=UPI002540B622|nr:uncharacterized protein N7478_011837 [Penicillium angulare]KAJ5261242.1 hypothetical protein N7478_011837 [Penicillium angulare]
MTFNSSYTIPTSLSISPVETNYINVWNQQITLGQTSVDQTSSVQAAPFPITFTPTIGGTTQVTGGTTSIMPAQTFTYGNLTYSKSAWTGVFGGTTSVTSGTTLSPTTSTVTPQPYPTDMSSKDTELNTKTTTVHASTKSGSSGPKATSSSEHVGSHCKIFCFGCAICPPGYASSEASSGGGSSGSGSSDDDDDDDDDDDTTTTNSEISSSTSSGETYITAAGAAKTVIADTFPTTTDPAATVEAVASRIKSLLSANYADVQSSLTAGVYASVYSTAAPICETITSIEDITSSIGRFDLAADYKVNYGGLSPEQHTYYDLNYFSSGVTEEHPCPASYRDRIGSVSPTPAIWSAVPEYVTWDYATWTVGKSTWTDCIYTNTAAPSYGDGAGTTTVLPLVSCPVSASTTSVHTITTTETSTYTSY